MIARMFLNNTHRVALELLPDTEMEARQAAEEAARLQVGAS